MKNKRLFALILTLAATVFLLVSPAEAKPPKPNVSWVFGPDPNTRGGTCKLPAGHTATVSITIANSTKTFTFTPGTTGTEIGWTSFDNKTHNTSTDASVSVVVKNASGRQVAQSKFNTRITSRTLNLSAPPRANAQIFSCYARIKDKGPWHIYLKDPSSVGKEVVHMLFSLK